MIGDPVAFLIGALFLVPAAALAIPAHELGHAWAAVWMGDPSPRNRGYLRPRLRATIEPIGALAILLANVGWGREVPINEYRLPQAGRKVVWCLGGPVANLLLAIPFALAIRVQWAQGVLPMPGAVPASPLAFVSELLYAVAFLNLSFFAFNLLPIPGLDGWRIIEALFRNRNPRFFFNVAARRQTIWIVCAAIAVIAPFLLHVDVLGAVVGIFYEPAAIGLIGHCSGYTTLNPCPLALGL
ncbi:MAG: site-2 protease family protein [Candidatus Dormiibacterota bacterium]